jgi:GNAT superfamily N-acetyltransferase
MASLYAQYIAERENKGIVESDKGFATYQMFSNGECYLQDLFVVPEHRQSHVATEMADQVVTIAKEHGCHSLIGSVCIDDREATRNLKVFLKYGMRVYKLAGTMIFLNKEIQ